MSIHEHEEATADRQHVIAALNLEYGANRRYAYQVEHSPFPRLNTILDGVRRTEGDHVEAMLDYLRQQQCSTPDTGRGFATMLAHLKLNVEFERIAVDAYARFARESEDPQLQKTFQRLTRSEVGHINLFQSIIDQIEANAYPAILYCPVCGWEVDFGVNPPDAAEERCDKCKQRLQINVVDGDFSAIPLYGK